MSKPGMEKGSTTNLPPQTQATGDEIKNYKNINRRQTNKSCPFACPNCHSLGGDLVRSKYEIVNILSDTGDSIFSPMHEKYHGDVNTVRNTGQVFLSADLVDSFFQQKFKK